MIPVLSTEQIGRADLFTQRNEPVSALDLMERAAKALAHKWMQEMGPEHKLRVLCGMGNNGGDGLALTRILAQKGYDVRALLIGHKPEGTPQVQAQIEALQNLDAQLLEVWSSRELESSDLPNRLDQWAGDAFLVDALLGNGLKGPARSPLKEVIRALNALENAVLSVDIPSGLNADGPPFAHADAVRATQTWAFDFYKKAFFLKSTRPFVGQVSILCIGLQADPGDTPLAWVPADEDIAALLPYRDDFAHKGDLGRAVLIAGSAQMGGAALLSAEACLRSGAGLLRVALPQQHVHTLLTRTPEAMVWPWQGDCFVDFDPKEYLRFNPQALGAGPGLGQDPKTARALKELLTWTAERSMHQVLDADALNLLPQNMVFTPGTTVITPHLGEFKRIIKAEPEEEQLWDQAKLLSQKLKATVLLKGAHTFIVDPEQVPVVLWPSCPALAVPGSGDVLTGIILALLARGLSPYHAALAGSFLHLKAGRNAQRQRGREGLLAHDLLDYLFREE